MRVSHSVVILSISLLSAGCANLHSENKYAPYPLAQMPEKAYQEKMQAAAHWEALSVNEAAEIAKVVPSNAAISFATKSNSSAFDKAYKKMLTSNLLKQGVRVASSSSGVDYLINYEAQIISHRGRDSQRMPAGSLTAATGGAFLIAHAAQHWNPAGLAIIPFAIAGDMYLANNRDAGTPNTEVLMTTEVHQRGQIKQSDTRIYYFNPGDRSLYTPSKPGKTFQVSNQKN